MLYLSNGVILVYKKTKSLPSIAEEAFLIKLSDLNPRETE